MMVGLFARASETRAELGPCYLYDRYCLEDIWKPEGGKQFGIDFTNTNWQTNPGNHYRGCFDVPKCKASGIALLCWSPQTTKYEKTYVSESLPNESNNKDYNTFYAYLDKLSGDAKEICVKLEADVGETQPVDPEAGSEFQAKFITNVMNIRKDTGCTGKPQSVEKSLSSTVQPTARPTTATETTTPRTMTAGDSMRGSCDRSTLKMAGYPTKCMMKMEGNAATVHFGYDTAANLVNVCVTAPEAQWVGFGPSKDGKMIGSIVALASEKHMGKVYKLVNQITGIDANSEEITSEMSGITNAAVTMKDSKPTLCFRLRADKVLPEISNGRFVWAVGSSKKFAFHQARGDVFVNVEKSILESTAPTTSTTTSTTTTKSATSFVTESTTTSTTSFISKTTTMETTTVGSGGLMDQWPSARCKVLVQFSCCAIGMVADNCKKSCSSEGNMQRSASVEENDGGSSGVIAIVAGVFVVAVGLGVASAVLYRHNQRKDEKNAPQE